MLSGFRWPGEACRAHLRHLLGARSRELETNCSKRASLQRPRSERSAEQRESRPDSRNALTVYRRVHRGLVIGTHLYSMHVICSDSLKRLSVPLAALERSSLLSEASSFDGSGTVQLPFSSAVWHAWCANTRPDDLDALSVLSVAKVRHHS